MRDMIDYKDKTECSGCYACVNACKVKCISMKVDEEGFCYPIVDASRCVNCGKCADCCPSVGETVFNNRDVQAYAAINKNEKIRRDSSSGGIFSALAQYVISQRGIVFGATFNKENHLEQIYVEHDEDLCKLRGAKYLQSQMGDCYKDAHNFLEEGRMVLFTGTPCQIAGFKKFLGRDYVNLLCVDIICHGVPSPKVWEHYLNYREKLANSKAEYINFRFKKSGWKRYSMCIKYKNQRKYIKRFYNDTYMNGYLANLFLRPSCYNCKFKTKKRISDITLGDFWGVENILPDMDDDKGISLVFIHSEKGENLFSNIIPYIKCESVDPDKAIEYNLSMVQAPSMPSARHEFISEVNDTNCEALLLRYGPKRPAFAKKLTKKLIRLVKK